MKTAFITGITGQDGSYLTELLLDKGYQVHGLIRRSSSFNTSRIDHVYENPNLHLHYGDMLDGSSLARLVDTIEPDEIYNLAAQSHVRVSFDQPVFTADVVALGTLRLLEVLRGRPKARMYQAGSSEMFGDAVPPQNEQTPFRPRSPYAIAKAAAHWHCVNYREAYGLFIANGILFNHESERRGETFVTRKITRGLARIAHGLQDKLYLGNLEARRDWGHAKDYVRAMWMMLQHDRADDFVVATGVSFSVREFISCAANFGGIDWKAVVAYDMRFDRPTEVNELLGNAWKIRNDLGWRAGIEFGTLVETMLNHDLELARKEKLGKG